MFLRKLRNFFVPQLFLCFLVLGGCARQFGAIRDNAEPFDQANGECVYRAHAAASAVADPAVGLAVQRRVFDACMRARGWAPT